jgi:hypothetical protein
MKFYFPNYDFYRTDREDGHKGGTAVVLKKSIPHACVELPLLLSVEATGSEAHPATYPMGTGSFLPGIERPGREADHLYLVPTSRIVELHLHSYHTSSRLSA